MGYFLFLDDQRTPEMVNFPDPYSDMEKIQAHNYNEFVEIIQKHGCPNVVSWDHDLSTSAYLEYERAHKTGTAYNYNNVKEKTGLDCCKYLINYCKENNLKFPIYFIHSMNHLGRKNINDLIKKHVPML